MANLIASSVAIASHLSGYAAFVWLVVHAA